MKYEMITAPSLPFPNLCKLYPNKSILPFLNADFFLSHFKKKLYIKIEEWHMWDYGWFIAL